MKIVKKAYSYVSNACAFQCRYIPLSRVSAFVADHDASPNCSFPSVTVCDEIDKLATTSLMRCSVGSLEAAVKVFFLFALYQYILVSHLLQRFHCSINLY